MAAKRVGYEDIAAEYRKKIESGELSPGDMLPSVKALAREFGGVADTTVIRALRMLKLEGLTLPKPGVGTVVAGPVSESIATRVARHAATGSAMARNESSRILRIDTVGASESVASRMGVEPGTPVLMRHRVVSRRGVPVHLSTSYYPAYVSAVAPELSDPVSTGGSRELAAERLGSEQKEVIQEVSARPATQEEKSTLGLSGDPVYVLQTMRTVTLTDDRVVEVAVRVASSSTVVRWVTDLRPGGE
ncbi:GntR family transcriptional regulator [Streptomyces sp. bgisy126]|uniref:GntR family transcriptional regulator n=1 Tax=unclassified Streptomyces TaxID=2593676 RepID=UPI003EBA34AC